MRARTSASVDGGASRYRPAATWCGARLRSGHHVVGWCGTTMSPTRALARVRGLRASRAESLRPDRRRGERFFPAAGIAIHHSTGRVEIGEASITIAAASATVPTPTGRRGTQSTNQTDSRSGSTSISGREDGSRGDADPTTGGAAAGTRARMLVTIRRSHGCARSRASELSDAADEPRPHPGKRLSMNSAWPIRRGGLRASKMSKEADRNVEPA